MIGLCAKCFVGMKDDTLKARRKARLELEIAALLGEHQKAPEDQEKARKVHRDVLDSRKGTEAVDARPKESSERPKGGVRQEASEVIGGVCACAAVFSVALVARVECHEPSAHTDAMEATDQACEKNTCEKGPHGSPSFRGEDSASAFGGGFCGRFEHLAGLCGKALGAACCVDTKDPEAGSVRSDGRGVLAFAVVFEFELEGLTGLGIVKRADGDFGILERRAVLVLKSKMEGVECGARLVGFEREMKAPTEFVALVAFIDLFVPFDGLFVIVVFDGK